ncbi:MAG: hypothetical protein E7566_06255 [Ruminococcaceae bacterium]|nr:hypothetical protein [Oscillospiraceae bacterium]
MDNNYRPKYLDVAYVVIRDIIKNWIAIVCIALSAAVFAYIIASVSYSPTYTSKCTLIVSAKNNNMGAYIDTTETEKLTDTIKATMKTSVLKKEVAKELGMSEFDGVIAVNVLPNTNLLTISVRSSRPNTAFLLLSTLLDKYPELTKDTLGDIVMQVFEEPSLPSAPSNPFKISRTISLSVIIATLAVILIAALYSYLMDTIKNEWDAAEKLDTKLLGIIYHEATYKNFRNRLLRKKKRILIGAPSVSFGFSETIKKLRTSLHYYKENNGGNVLLVTSYEKGEGKSTLAANLAYSTTQKNQKVLLIPGSIESSSLLNIFSITLPEEFLNQKKTSLKDYVYTLENGKLSILINSFDDLLSSNYSDFIASEDFKAFIQEAKEIYDSIIIDGPCVKSSADAEVFAKVSDYSILAVKQHCTKTPLLNDTIDMLNKYNKGVAGFVFNDVYSSATVINIGYGYGYGRKIDYGYGRYGKYGRYGHYGSYGKYGKYGKYGNYNKYGAYYQHGKYEARREK